MGDPDVEPNENIYLPASFLGSKRWASEQVSDSLAIAAAYGNPTFFVTMTCNPEWPEIQSQLHPGQDFTDIPVVVVRVFKRKLTLLLQALKAMFPNVGRPEYCIHCVEFQKRGLPHSHILIRFPVDCFEPTDIDRIVSAEIPADAEDAKLVRKFMLHNHPLPTRPAAKYCQRESADGTRTCRFNYPHPLQPTTTIDVEGRVHYRRRQIGDEMVVPHCLALLRKFQCHINFEVASSSHIFQYLFKYIHKRKHDHHCTVFALILVQFRVAGDNTRYKVTTSAETRINEIEEFWDTRYLSAGEAAWRIMGFHVTKKEPAVTALPIHLPDTQSNHQYLRSSNHSVLSQLNRYFLPPAASFTAKDGSVRHFDDLTYADYYTLFRLEKYSQKNVGKPNYFVELPNSTGSPRMHVVMRNFVHAHVTRIRSVRPSQGELFYLRAILQNRPTRSFEMTRTVADVEFSTFQEAALELGLFADSNEAMFAISEGVQSLRTPRELRILFVHLLVNECVLAPLDLWEMFQQHFAYDYILQNNNVADIGIIRHRPSTGGVREEAVRLWAPVSDSPHAGGHA
jgi:hypothetical protein